MPPCSLCLGTLNVNGTLYSSERDLPALLAHLMQSADIISILGITYARISPTEVEPVKAAFRRYLLRGTAIIAFLTERPYDASHPNTIIGGQVILLNEHWEKWAGHHRSNPSGLSLVVEIRLTYRSSSLSIIKVMVPSKSPGPNTMWRHLVKYLAMTNNPFAQTNLSFKPKRDGQQETN